MILSQRDQDLNARSSAGNAVGAWLLWSEGHSVEELEELFVENIPIKMTPMWNLEAGVGSRPNPIVNVSSYTQTKRTVL